MFDEEELDETQSAEDFTKATISTALKGEHRKFEFITHINEYYAAQLSYKALAKLVKGFRSLKKHMYKDYLTNRKAGKDDIAFLYNYRTFETCETFYKKELELVDDSMDEYWAYAFSGHILDILLGHERPLHDLHDFRKSGGHPHE